VQNDLLQAVDSQGGAIPVLLDLSIAFDTIDHAAFLHALETCCRISGTALKWFASYLTDRLQAVKIGQSILDFIKVVFGVPQGSVLGPILLTLLTAPLSAIVSLHGLLHHFYADDSQHYIVFNPHDSLSREEAVAKVEACAEYIRKLITNNFLKQNDDKTESIIVTSRKMVFYAFAVTVGNNVIALLPQPPCNLGVFFNNHLSFEHHVQKVSQSVNAAFFKIGKIRKYLDSDSCNQLINGLMKSHLDYCNSLLYSVSDTVLHHLQLLQNWAARILFYTLKFNHITPVLRELHWLPVQQRIIFKILLLGYKCQLGLASSYLSDLIHPYTLARDLRSSNLQHGLLFVPRSRIGFGDRSFEVAAPTLWNSLPADIKQSSSVNNFKRTFKTYLFKEAFPD
jgi:hypothetical protein